MTSLLEKAKQLKAGTTTAVTTKEVSATPTAVYAHGPGGLFSPAGLGDTAVGTHKRKKKRKPVQAQNGAFNAMLTTTKPGDKYDSILLPKVYERLIAKGMSKSQAAAISNAMAKRAGKGKGKGKGNKEVAAVSLLERAKELRETVKHLTHNQKRHGWRFNQEYENKLARNLGTARNSTNRGTPSAQAFEREYSEYMSRAMGKWRKGVTVGNSPKPAGAGESTPKKAMPKKGRPAGSDELVQLQKRTPKQRRADVATLSKKPLKELRRMQDLFSSQIKTAVSKNNLDALQKLQIKQDDLIAAIMQQNFKDYDPLAHAKQLQETIKHVSHDQKAHGARHGVGGLREFAKKRGYSVTDRGEGAKHGRYEIRNKRGDNMRSNGLTSAKKLIAGANKHNIQADRKQAKRKRGGFEVGQVVMPKQGNSTGVNNAYRGRIVRFDGNKIVYRPLNARPGSFADNEFVMSIGDAMASAKEYIPLEYAKSLRPRHASHNQASHGENKPTKKTTPPTFTVFKDKTGRYRWVAISSTAYRDRDGEIVSTKALTDDVAHADASGNYGPLRWWHVDGLDLGDCDFNMVYGRSLIESGTFKNDRIAERVKEKAHSLRLSLGFRHPANEPDTAGVFHNIRRFERSLIPPEGNASNLFTRLAIS